MCMRFELTSIAISMRRFRIKAVANIPQRRKGEGKDEGKDDKPQKNNEVREDPKEQIVVACSPSISNNIQHQENSSIIEPITSNVSNAHEISARPEEEFSTFIQRKCKRTEQSRKMAEARRHFVQKFGSEPPPKHKLKMIDLIFYNPSTNPMTQSQTSKTKKEIVEVQSKKEELTQIENEDEEHADEPEVVNSEPQDQDKGEEDGDGLPAPQIKIGPDGEIVVDEQSLVIENAETKKNRQKLQNSAVVDGDFDSNYGVYKRVKRSKDWSKEETLRFYKALNSIGTDFTLMQEYFPGRDRRDLKAKYKKEDRVNRPLIDRALTKPIPFDVSLLKEMAEKEEREVNEKLRRLAETKSTKAEKRALGVTLTAARIEKLKVPGAQKRRKSRRTSAVAKKKKTKDLYSKVEEGIDGILEEDDEESSSDSSVSSDYSLSSILRPTRSGRVPRSTRVQSPDVEDMQLISRAPLPRTEDEEPTTPEPEVPGETPNKLTVGSLLVLSSKNNIGKPVYQVFMVGPDQTRTPLTTVDVQEYTRSVPGDQQSSTASNDSTIPVDEVNASVTGDESADQVRAEDTDNVNQDLGENERMILQELVKSIVSFSATPIEHSSPPENNITIPAES